MRVSLLYPPVSTVDRYGVDIGDIGGRQAPLGILYLAAYLRKAGHEVQVIDAEAERLPNDEIVARLKSFCPDAIGISITTVAWKSSVDTARAICQALPDALLIAGGPHITAYREDSLTDSPFQVGIYGEGEVTLLELLKAANQPERWSEIPGLVIPQDSGKASLTPPRNYIPDLDELPSPARDLLSDIKLYRPPIGCYKEEFVVSVITSRGCPYQCIFCDNNTFGRKIRYLSPERVVDEITEIVTKYGARELTFVDDTFPSKKSRFIRILELIKQRDLSFHWTCMANLNDLNEEAVKLMKETGCWQVAVGVESGDDDVLKTIKKGLTTAIIREKVELLHRHGILAKGFFMMGHPGDTPETLRKTTEFALQLPLTDVTCTIATPIRGSEFYTMATSGQYGPFNAEAPPAQFNYWEPVFCPAQLTPEQLYQAQRRFFKRFYLRPQILWRQLRKIRNLTILKRTLVTVWKVVKMKAKG